MMARGLLGFVLAAWPALAHADLASDVRTLQLAHAEYGKLVHLKPRLLERGDRMALPIPPELLDPRDPSCATVSILGVPGLHFAVRFSELDPSAPASAFAEASVAGASQITRCGPSKPFLAGVFLEMRSPRGVIETVVSRAPASAPRLTQLLPSRDAGMELPLGDPGPRPAAPPLGERLKRLAERAARDGAHSEALERWQAGDDGSGVGVLTLDAGCHELTLLADAPRAVASLVDLDLELVDSDSGARLGVDRAEDADGALSVCLGLPVRAELRYVGAPPHAALSLVHARFDFPKGIPEEWGPEARAGMAKVARAQRLPLPGRPVYSSLGVQGTTELPLEVEPDACYSALVVPLRGEVRSLSLSAVALAPSEVPRGDSDTEGSAVAFCAHGARHASLEVTGEGANLAWLLAVWQSGRAPLGAREP